MGAVQNPLAKQRALLAMRDQAARWLAAYKADLVARGLGFTPEDVAAVDASAAAHPLPAEQPGFGTKLSMIWVGLKAIAAELPGRGAARGRPAAGAGGRALVPGVRRRRPRDRLGHDDPALIARVTAALGQTPENWQAAIDGWTERITDDVVVATMYGQLFSQVGRPAAQAPRAG